MTSQLSKQLTGRLSDPVLPYIMKILLLILILSGCSAHPAYESYKAAAKAQAEKSADKTLKVAGWTVCKATTRGALKRFADTEEKERRFDEFCELFSLARIE